MPLPDWAVPPEPGFDHGDNYSVLEVVWTHPDGRVVVQLPPSTEGPGEGLDRPQADNPHIEHAPPRRRRFGRRAAR